MKCPYCNLEMKKGSIPGEGHPCWISEGTFIPPIRAFVPDSGIRLVLDKSSMFYKRAEAYYCSECKIVIALAEK